MSPKTKYLYKDEIEKISATNPTLEKVYERFKNYDGYIGFREFTYLMGNKVDDKIKRKLFKIFTVYNNNVKFNFEILKNFYAIFYNNYNDNAKTLFLADLIFGNKTSKKLSKYVERVVLLFNKADSLKNLLLEKQFYSKFTSKETNLLQKEGLIALLNNSVHQNFIRQFNYINYVDTNKTYSKYTCNCYKKRLSIEKDKPSNNGDSKNNKSSEADNLNDVLIEEEFKRLESKSDGIFEINTLEIMLSEVDVDVKLINLITGYIKRKTEKVNIIFIFRIL